MWNGNCTLGKKKKKEWDNPKMSLQYVNKKIDLIQINLLSKKFFCTSASFPSTGTVFIFKKEQQEIFLKDRKKKYTE